MDKTTVAEKLNRAVATSVRVEDGRAVVRYHHTDVVTYDVKAGTVTLNTGGYTTATTKTRMNQAAAAFGLGFKVYQKDFSFFVTWDGADEAHEFPGNVITIPAITR